jgi:hypothetical protein
MVPLSKSTTVGAMDLMGGEDHGVAPAKKQLTQKRLQGNSTNAKEVHNACHIARLLPIEDLGLPLLWLYVSALTISLKIYLILMNGLFIIDPLPKSINIS